MAKITREQLNQEITRAGEAAKLSPTAISTIIEAAATKNRISTYSLRTSNGVRHPLALAGIVGIDGSITGSKTLKAPTKIDRFLREFAPTGAAERANSFVDVG